MDVVICDKTINLQIMYIAGHNRYQSLGSTFNRGIEACVLVYETIYTSSVDEQLVAR